MIILEQLGYAVPRHDYIRLDDIGEAVPGHDQIRLEEVGEAVPGHDQIIKPARIAGAPRAPARYGFS